MYRYHLLLLLTFAIALALLVQAIPNDDGNECTEGFVTEDRIAVLLERTGLTFVPNNLQAIFPDVGFTCTGNLHRIVFGATSIQQQRSQRPQLQIWRPVEDTTYMLVHKFALELTSNSRGLHEYVLPSNTTIQAGDVIGYYQPDTTMSQFRLLLEGESSEGHQCSYRTEEQTGLFSNLDVSGIQLSCTSNIFFHPITDPPECGCGFMSTERMRYVSGISSVPSTTTTTDQRQQISPDMRFTCDAFITKWTIMAQYAVDNSLYPELQIWRNIENSTVYKKISGVSITMPLRQFSGVYEFDNFPPIAVKSGDILGISIPDRSSARLQLLSEITSASIQYYTPIDPSSSSSYDVIDIQSSLVISSAYRPVVSVAFVRVTPSQFKVITSTLTTDPTPPTEARASSSVCVCEREEVGTTGLSPSSESSQRSSVGVCVGAGVGVALASIIAVLLVAIVIVILMVVVRRKQTAKKGKVVVTRDSRNTMDNPTYSGTAAEAVYSDVKDEAVYEVPTESEERSGADTRTRTTTNASNTYAEFDNPLYQPN